VARVSAGPLLRVTALVEGATAVALLLLPSLTGWLLFGQPLDAPLAQLAARIAGAALLSLAIACWWIGAEPAGRAARGLVMAVLVYNLIALGVLIYGGVGLSLSGMALWPAIAAHAALALWCGAALLARAR
jgi:hypothetical protein